MSRNFFVDMVSAAEVAIRRPVEVVWPCLLNQEAWMKDFAVERIAGPRDSEGEVRRLRSVDIHGRVVDGVEPFCFKTLRLQPFREFAYKAYTERREGEYWFTGMELLYLQDHKQSTSVTFEVYLEFQSDRMGERELREFVAQVTEGSKGIWARNFSRLSVLAHEKEREI